MEVVIGLAPCGLVMGEPNQIADNRRRAAFDDRRFPAFLSSRSSARARGNKRPSGASLDEKNMKPPGTRTAMPTVRRSNSTAKRWLGTELLQCSRRIASSREAHQRDVGLTGF
jgi:hypothetical protein